MMQFFKCIKHLARSGFVGIKALAQKDPPFFELFHDYEEYHEEEHITGNSLIRLKLIEDWIVEGSSVLDVGCGEGFTMEYLAKKKRCKVRGLDISRKAVEKVKSKGFEAWVRDIDLQGLGLEHNEHFDYILLTEVIEHTKYPHRILREACRHAQKGIIVTLPNTGYIYWRTQLLRGYFPRQSFMHLHFWSIRDFELFLKSLGLEILDFKTELDYYSAKSLLCKALQNIIAYQQSWLIKPYSKLAKTGNDSKSSDT